MSNKNELFKLFLQEEQFIPVSQDILGRSNVYHRVLINDENSKPNDIVALTIVYGGGNYVTFSMVYKNTVAELNEKTGYYKINTFSDSIQVYSGLIPEFELLKNIYHLCFDEVLKNNISIGDYINNIRPNDGNQPHLLEKILQKNIDADQLEKEFNDNAKRFDLIHETDEDGDNTDDIRK